MRPEKISACVCPSSAEVVDSMDPKLAADTNQNYDLLLSLSLAKYLPALARDRESGRTNNDGSLSVSVMGKRKSSFDKKQAAKKRAPAPTSSNPFLVAWTSEDAASSSSPSDAVLDHLIQITDLSRQKDESHIQTLYSHVDFLLEFLQTSDPIST